MEPAAAEPERATVARAAPPRAPEAGRPVPAPVRPSPQPAPATPFVAPEGDAVADLGAPEPPDSLALLDRYAAAATSGRLTASDIMVMEMIQADDRGYDRSRMLLLMNAKNRGDIAQQKRYLDDLSRRPENAYNPVVLVESARYHVNRGEYRKALDEAVLAERHWARLPPDLVIAKKTEIYEVQASAAQGLFYRSEDDLNLLDAAVRGWQKYREYVASTSRADLVARADREIARLETTRKRLK